MIQSGECKMNKMSNISSMRIFENFEEYWHYIKCLSPNQKKLIFSSLSSNDKDLIKKSIIDGGWTSLYFTDQLESIIDDIKEKYGIDLIGARAKVLMGKSVYLPRDVWEEAIIRIIDVDPKFRYAGFIVGELNPMVCKLNDNLICLLKKGQEE